MNEKISKIVNNPMFVPITVGIASFGTGVGLGYILGRRNRYEVYEVPQQTNFHIEVDELRDIVPKQEDIEPSDGEAIEPEFQLNDKVKSFVERKIQEAETVEMIDEEVEEEVVDRNVFAGNTDDWDYDKELKNRSSSEPYVLHKDEFYADELGYTQTTLTYYAGDNIMADEEETPVYSFEKVTGPLKFGHGSEDPNVFYVRNDKRKAEYEILFDQGLYSVEVLGLEIENNARVKDIKHSDQRKFKLD